jgi:CIC family chloride channel protein
MNLKKVRKYYRLFKGLQGIEEKGTDVIQKHEIPLQWLHKKLTHNQFLILSGILVGCTGGLAGVALKYVVHLIEKMITRDYHFSFPLLFYLIFPVIGIVGTVLVIKFFFHGDDEKGIPSILESIAQKSSLVKRHIMYSQLIQSAITVGFGGSAGLESPSAVTGAAIGSNFGRIYRLNYKDRTLLLAAGSAAGIAAAFGAPVAGVMFAVEVILSGVTFSDFIPLIIASVCGGLLAEIILGNDVLLHFSLKQPFNYHFIFFYILLGLFVGFYSRYYMVASHKIHLILHAKFPNKLMLGICGGLLLSVLCFVFPPLFGQGYLSVKVLVDQSAAQLMHVSLFKDMASNEWVILGFIGLVGLFKAFATSITMSSGGNGGNFAPSIVAGAFAGYFFAMFCRLAHIADLPAANFAIVGMAGAVSGILYAPLTGIFLIAEVTGGYDLFIPLMIVSAISYLVVKRFSAYSLDYKPLVDSGKIFSKHYDNNLLSLLHTTDIIEKDIKAISPGSSLRELVELVKVSKRNMFGVVNQSGELEGIVMLDDIRNVIFKTELYDNTTIRQLMKAPPAFIDVNDSMRVVMKKFDETMAWNLPVVKGKKFLGFISKSSLLNNYRRLLIERSPEEE